MAMINLIVIILDYNKIKNEQSLNKVNYKHMLYWPD